MTYLDTVTDVINTIDGIAEGYRTDRRCVTTICTALNTVYVEMTERAVDTCTRCGPNLPPAGPVDWLDERTGAYRGACNQQHGCGEWNSPESVLVEIVGIDTLASMDDWDRVDAVRDRLAAAAAELDAAVAGATQTAVGRIRAELAGDVRYTLARVTDIAADTTLTDEEKADALADLETGGGEEPGVYRDGGHWQAWAWFPRRDSGEVIIVSEADL